MGRPSDYTQELAALICSRISEGESLRSVCRDENMPGTTAVFQWLARHTEFAEQYARATQARADAFAEEIIEISDDGSNDTYEVEGVERVNNDVIQRSKLRVDTRKWLMARMQPKKYGDRIEQVQTGADGGAVKVEQIQRIELVPAEFPADHPAFSEDKPA